jgi:hypothetical protein
MTQQADLAQQAVGYCRHQAEKGVDSLAALMERTSGDWQRCLEGMSEEQAGFAPGNEWPARTVVNHFLGVTVGVNKQIRRFTSGIMPSATDEETLSAEGGGVEATTVPEMRKELDASFLDMIALTRSLQGNENLDAQFPHPMFGQLNILEWIAFQRLHSQDHIQQIEKNKAADGYPAN